jgi:hypothetical protein
MKGSFFKKCLALMLTLTLVIGPGVFAPVSAAPADHSATIMQDMSGMSMSGAYEAHKGCCPSSEKSQDTKGSLCASACAGMTQATMPSLFPTFLHEAAILPFEHADTSAAGRQPLPDYPPPKA